MGGIDAAGGGRAPGAGGVEFGRARRGGAGADRGR